MNSEHKSDCVNCGVPASNNKPEWIPKSLWKQHMNREIRDSPNTATTIIFQKSFASDVASKRHLMAHQMLNLCVFLCVPLCRRGIWRSIRGYPQMKNVVPRDELKNGLGCVGSSLRNVNGGH